MKGIIVYSYSCDSKYLTRTRKGRHPTDSTSSMRGHYQVHVKGKVTDRVIVQDVRILFSSKGYLAMMRIA